MNRASARFWLAALVLPVACRSGDAGAGVVRGHGLVAATLPAGARAEVYRAALDAAFDLSDPSLTLLLDPRLLPRSAGFAPGGPMDPALVSELRRRNIVLGTCAPPITESRKAPRCDASGPGYLVRFTDVLALPGDSVEVYLSVQRFDLPSSVASHFFRFERAYQITGSDEHWRAAREGRIPENRSPLL